MYTQADVIMICFSLVSKASYENVIPRWMPEVRLYCSNIPIILVGTQMDLRNINTPSMYQEDGLALKDKISAVDYKECSAKTLKGLSEVFESVIEIAEGSAEEEKGCNLM